MDTPAGSWKALLADVAGTGCEVVITCASGGRAVIVSEDYLADLRSRAGARPDLALLTPRELEILTLSAEGHKSADIADLLGLATNTVAQHLVSVRRKLRVRTTKAAAEILRVTAG